MGSPTEQEREALLELLLAMSGPLMWTGPIPYDALGARHTAEHRDAPLGVPRQAIAQVATAPRSATAPATPRVA